MSLSPATVAALPPDRVYEALGSRPAGLTTAEAAEGLARVGPNRISEVKKRSILLRFVSNFTHIMAILLWIAGVVAFVAGLPQLGVAIWSVNLINGAFSFWQEYRAERATDALRRLLPTYARVVRDGLELRTLAEELVPGDVILLSEGDHVSVDARLVESAELRVNQSTLTGESLPVPKTAASFGGADLTAAETPDLVFAGTNVAAGTGRAVVWATGMQTAFGEIARLTQTVTQDLSPLQVELSRLTRIVSAIAVSVGLAFFLLSVLLVGISPAESFIFAMGMVVAFVPEGMLPTVTLSLAIGVQRMVRRHALIKRLSAVETLGCTTVICTDKTGTLTMNEMAVRGLWRPGARFSVTGPGCAPEGEVRLIVDPAAEPPGHPAADAGVSAALVPPRVSGNRAAQTPASDDPDLELLLTAASLCSNARLVPPHEDVAGWTALGDPTEAALLGAAAKAGIDATAALARLPRVREVPFDSERKRMTTVHLVGAGTTDVTPAADAPSVGAMGIAEAGDWTVFVKGAPREVLSLCAAVRRDGVDLPLDERAMAEVVAAVDTYAADGLRVLGVAVRAIDRSTDAVSATGIPSGPPTTWEAADLERDLTFLGLAAMMDPPRPEVAEAVQRCHRAGIRIIMITGDYGLTAESIARRIGILQEGHPRIITGPELLEVDEVGLEKALEGEVIFARVAPEQKLRVVTALQAQGHVVAVTGDGVNDAPALKKADIGVAMGVAGTDVAKEAADMVLTDDNFASIVNAVEEGRAVYANIKKFASYIFTSNTPEAVPFIFFAFSGGRIPLALTIMQILSIDLGTDMAPAIALGAEPPEPGVMDRPPRDRREHAVTARMLARDYLWLGPVQSLATMLSFYLFFWTNGFAGRWIDLPSDGDVYTAATAMALAAVVTTQIGNLFAHRTERASGFKVGLFSNRLIWLGLAVEMAFVLCVIYLPPLQYVFGTGSFAAQYWVWLFAWAPALFVMDELRKWVVRRRAGSHATATGGDGPAGATAHGGTGG